MPVDRLPFGELDCDPQLVLFGFDDHVGALTLGIGHVRPQLADIVVVLDPLGE